MHEPRSRERARTSPKTRSGPAAVRAGADPRWPAGRAWTRREWVVAAAGVAALAGGLSRPRPAWAIDPVYKSAGGAALAGQDVVAYHTEGRLVEGRREFEAAWHGATWRFASAENRDAFRQNPEKYAPQYGGYCAYAVARGYTATTDPAAWKIVDGKLYLNYSRAVRDLWGQDIPGNIRQGNQNWPQILER